MPLRGFRISDDELHFLAEAESGDISNRSSTTLRRD